MFSEINKSVSVPTPYNVAENSLSNSYAVRTLPDVVKDVFNVSPERMAYLDDETYLILTLCFMYGMRVSEVLALRWENVLDYDRVFVRAAKRGRDYLIYVPDISRQRGLLRSPVAQTPLFAVDYQHVYRACRRAGINLKFDGHKNASVTHAGRHLIGRAVVKAQGEAAVSDVLHHRGKSSARYYTGAHKGIISGRRASNVARDFVP